jgi:tetratricopeptide (TPR) repeat protein
MRRAETAFERAMSRRDWDAAERYYQSALENAQAITDPALRERLTRGLAMNRVCLLAHRGDTDEAEQFAAPMVATFDAEFSRIGRLTAGQNAFWSCLSFAQRQNRRYAEAVRTTQTIIERCRATKLSAMMACEMRPLREKALAELDWGRNVEALATMQEYLKSGRKLNNDPNTALAYGRALLANGRAQEAVEPLRMAYGAWLSSNQPSALQPSTGSDRLGSPMARSSAAAG